MDTVIIEKPWGKEEILEHNEYYILKRISMSAGHRCSLQYHTKKKETVLCLSGELKIYLEDDEIFPCLNHVVTINPTQLHRMEAITDSVYLEVSTSHLDDVVRVQDDYDRS